MFNEIEEKIITVMKENFGSVYEEMEEELVQMKINKAYELYDIAISDFRQNQSASNYNTLLGAMLALQYWRQKKVSRFSTTEDF